MNILKQSTSITVRVGPAVDASDGVTPETGLTLGSADQAEALKANGAATVDISGNTLSAVTGADGWYDLTLTAGNVDTIGELVIAIQDSSLMLPIFARFQVVEEDIYDALFASSAGGFDSNAQVTPADGSITSNKIATDAIGSNQFAQAAADKVWGSTTRTLTSLGASLVQEIWDRATSALSTAGSIGKLLVDNINATISSRSSHDDPDPNGYIANLNVGGNVASSAEVTAIQNTTRSKAVHPSTIERPDSGSISIKLKLFLYDTNGQMENADSTPSLAITNDAGTDRSGNLSAVSSTGTGEYEADYTVASSHSVENLRLVWTYTEGGNTIKVPGALVVVDTTAVDFTAADRAKLERLDTDYTTTRAGNLDNLDAAISSRSSHTVQNVVDGTLDEVNTGATHNVQNSVGRQIRTAQQSMVIREGQIQAATSNTVTLDANASSTDDLYNHAALVVAGEGFIITDYNGTTKVATLDHSFVGSTPGSGADFEVVPSRAVLGRLSHTGATIPTINNLLEADRYIDTSPTPWQFVLIQKGTGGLGVGTELLRQDLKDVNGNDITATSTVIGQSETP